MSFGLLPIRIIAGIGFIMNGLPKLANITGTQAEFATIFGLPAALALPGGLLEVIGGIALSLTLTCARMDIVHTSPQATCHSLKNTT